MASYKQKPLIPYLITFVLSRNHVGAKNRKMAAPQNGRGLVTSVDFTADNYRLLELNADVEQAFVTGSK